jgi:hypothetical protein
VDCEPLGRRQRWLLTALQQQLEVDGFGIAVIGPDTVDGDLADPARHRNAHPPRLPARNVLTPTRVPT